MAGDGHQQGRADILVAEVGEPGVPELFPHLDERQRRLAMGAEARVLGRGGIKMVARVAGVSAATVSRGVAELETGGEPPGRVRRAGGGRKPVAESDPGLVPALLALVEPRSRGDPESPLRWTTKSARHLAAGGHQVSAPTVATLLKEENFSLQGNAKTIEGAGHPDRDAQFRYINDQARQHMDAGDPVISADTKKKELAGRSGRGGREWQPKGGPEQVRVHDFMDKQLGKAIPHGYDIAANAGWVNVGTAELDTGSYPSGIKVSDRDMKNLEKRAVRRHGFHGEWNYNLIPRPE